MFLFIGEGVSPLHSWLNSNTSHVLIYRPAPQGTLCLPEIQIHLMFLFIKIGLTLWVGLSWYSNTSHVLIYHCHFLFSFLCFTIQIHLMFLFIELITGLTTRLAEFKYISCSYLSINIQLKSINISRFKYISCSYLSGVHSASGNSVT